MKKYLFSVFIASLLAPTSAFAYGEGSTIPYESRVIHLLTNEVRTDVHTAIDACGKKCHEGKHCYERSYKALYWDDNLYKAATFHATMLATLTPPKWGCIQHPSPCQLVDNFASLFPDKCDGNPSCACKTGKATCGTQGTRMGARVTPFGTQAAAENIVANTKVDPYEMFYMLFNEDSTADVKSQCGFTHNNGHRVNILADNQSFVGIGLSNMIAVQDFGRTHEQVPIQPISSGSHYTDDEGALYFKMHYDAKVKVQATALTLGSKCVALKWAKGNNYRGIWSMKSDKNIDPCTPYFYEAIDTEGNITRYPTTGALLYNCKYSWTNKTDNLYQGCINAVANGSIDNNNGSDNNNNNNSDNNNNGSDNPPHPSGSGSTGAVGDDDSDLDFDCAANVYRPANNSLWLLLSIIPLGYIARRNRKMTRK